jgi:hypothetical protein
MNNKNSNFPLMASWPALLLSVGFSAIMLYYVVGVYEIAEKTGWVAGFVFVLVNLIILMVITVYGRALAAMTSPASYIQAWFMFTVYSGIHILLFALGLGKWETSTYVFRNLLLLFVFVAIVYAIISIGKKPAQAQDGNSVDPTQNT